jgi:hypothetical protein
MDLANDARIYLLEDGERQVGPDGPAVVGPDGVRHDLPPAVFEAVWHVVEAMRADRAVKVVPVRTELPYQEAAAVAGIRPDVLRRYMDGGTIGFRSTRYHDWVLLAEVLAFQRGQADRESDGVRRLLNEQPDDDIRITW